MLEFTDAEIRAKATQLGLTVSIGSAPLPPRVLAKAKAALVEERRAAARQERPAEKARLAQSIVVQPGGDILVDGEPFPWLVARVPMEIGLNPQGPSTVRLTLLAETVQVLKPNQNEESE